MLGVFRPSWDAQQATHPEHLEGTEGQCLYHPLNGRRFGISPGSYGSSFEGSQSADEGDRIGMLLDLDQGSMTVYKDGDRLGVMVAEGLSGEYCWGVVLGDQQESLSIGAGAAVPPSPTEEELAAAKAWQPAAAEALPGVNV